MSENFPTDPTDLSNAEAPTEVELGDGDTFDLRIAPVAKQLNGDTVRMLAYNGSIPGPILRVKEGSEIVVNIENHGDLEGTVHWHGLRLDNAHDGTHETQKPMEVGESYRARVAFPDPGVYWYHPHIREDYTQEMGLYGNVLVEPADPDYWPPAHREIPLTLDDVLLTDGAVGPFSRTETTYAAMGRFGEILLIGGETTVELEAKRGEVIRFFLTNTANTRVFNLALPGGRMKLVGGDSGRVEHEQLVESVVLGPSERVVVDVLFDQPGRHTVEHRTPEKTYELGQVSVSDAESAAPLESDFDELRTNEDMVAERERARPYLEAEAAKTIAFLAEMEMGDAEGGPPYCCPMHPEVIRDDPGNCPKCGMKLVSSALVAGGEHEGHGEMAAHGEMHETHEADGHEHGAATIAGGIEWEDDMVEMNRMTTPANMRWMIVDRETGAENAAIDWQFRVGELVKIRVLNEMAGDHPMHHPFHIHGAGRFLILARDGETEENLVWKDTVLIPAGQTVDLLLEVTNPGRWMAHCHIAEHHESGMMFSFDVTE